MAYELASVSNYININIDPYLLIEISLLKYFTNNNLAKLKDTSTINKSESISEKPQIISREIISKEKILPAEEENNELKKIRINNCFVNAKKEYLQNIKASWPEFISNLEDKSLLNLLIDSNIVAASDKVAILTNIIDGTVKLINKNLEELSEYYKSKFNIEYQFIALTESEWNREKQVYITNLKNKVEYKYIEEPKNEKVEEQVESIEKTAFDIFEKNKIEIE